MSQNTTTPEATWDDRAGRKTISIWDRWQPACDACGRRESSLKERLSYCSSCYVVKYCSAECQKRDWSAGGHKNQCHLFEIDRKLSDVFLKSLGRGFAHDLLHYLC
ncbi:hypothetical protein B0H11DRAFT_2003743 [Mycena galericulata]|nr:hypothetical protein B0H11DRAFT_2003743 [Mycena galericulata]